MYCPEGYVHYLEVIDACISASFIVLPWDKEKEHVWHDEGRGGNLDWDASREVERKILQANMLNRFVRDNGARLYACNPSGGVMRVMDDAARPIFYNHFGERTAEYFRQGIHREYVDIETGTVDVEGMPARLRYVTGGEPLAQRGAVIAALRPLQGWPLCFRADGLAWAAEEIAVLWGDRPPEEDTRSVGRPRIRDNVGEAYRKCFPSGHGDLTYKAVLKVLRDREDVIASVDTLRRALED